MNQSLLLNDDLKFNAIEQCWIITGFYNGLSLSCYISKKYLAENTNINEGTLFDIETLIEDWLNENDIENDIIYIE